MRQGRAVAWGLTAPWTASFAIFWAFPLAYSITVSLTDYSLLSKQSGAWVGLGNYFALFADPNFLNALENTFLFVIGTVPITTIVALMLALLVSRNFRGRAFFRSIYFLPSITSMVVVALIFSHLYKKGGYVMLLAETMGLSLPTHGLLYDSGTALYAIMGMDIWMSSGYYMLIFLAGLKAIPDELYEAAEISGASYLRQLFSITLPMLRPVALFIIVINTIKSFQIFVEIFVMTQGSFDTSTLVYFLYDKGLTTSFEFGLASAAAMVLFVIIALFSAAQFVLMRQRKALW